MSRHKPIALRHKHSTAAPAGATTRTIGRLGLKIAAILCGLFAVSLGVSAVMNAINNKGVTHWEFWALLAGAVGAGVLAWRVFELKLWACYTTAVVGALVCILEPWRQANYPGAVVDPSAAIAAGVMGCVLFVAPLTVACIVERAELKSGF